MNIVIFVNSNQNKELDWYYDRDRNVEVIYSKDIEIQIQTIDEVNKSIKYKKNKFNIKSNLK